MNGQGDWYYSLNPASDPQPERSLVHAQLAQFSDGGPQVLALTSMSGQNQGLHATMPGGKMREGAPEPRAS